jgi:5-formyltetrahydrofolate cyclo-ligase
VKQKKRLLRRDINSRIAAASPETRADWSRSIVERVLNLDCYRTARTVLAFYPLPDETDITPLLEAVITHGKQLYLPRVDKKIPGRMAAVRVTDLKCLVPSKLSILEPPKGDILDDFSKLDLVIAPGRAFDAEGHRVGRGGGYYDRLFEKLASHTKRVGVAFSCQIVDEVPREEWDAGVDMIVSENGIISVGH